MRGCKLLTSHHEIIFILNRFPNLSSLLTCTRNSSVYHVQSSRGLATAGFTPRQLSKTKGPNPHRERTDGGYIRSTPARRRGVLFPCRHQYHGHTWHCTMSYFHAGLLPIYPCVGTGPLRAQLPVLLITNISTTVDSTFASPLYA